MAECSGFTSFVWISLSNLINLFKLSSNSANFAWYALMTSSCSEIWLLRSLIFSSLNSILLLNYSGIPFSFIISSWIIGFRSLHVARANFSFSFSALSYPADLCSSESGVWLPPRMKVPCSFWKLVGAELSVSEGLKPGFMTSLIVRLAVIFLVNVKR